MEMKKEDLELYADYLICTSGNATATGLSSMLDGEISHDRVTRFLKDSTCSMRCITEGRCRFRWRLRGVRRPVQLCDVETHPLKRASEVTKNELMRAMIGTCMANQLQFTYVLMEGVWPFGRSWRSGNLRSPC